MPKFNFNHCKSIFKFLIFCLWIKILLFNYNIENNLTIILTIISEGSGDSGGGSTYCRRLTRVGGGDGAGGGVCRRLLLLLLLG
jgi:hypothetical protein